MSLAIDGAVAAGARPTWRESLKQLQVRIKAHNVVIMCAGIAFYGVLALVPTLVALVTVYGIVTDPAEIADQIVSLSERMDQSTAELIGTQLDEIVRSAKGSDGTLALIVSIVLALFSASAAVQKLMLSVSMAYATLEGRKGWVVRGLAYLFTAGAIVGIALIVFLLGALPTLMDEVGPVGPDQGATQHPSVPHAWPACSPVHSRSSTATDPTGRTGPPGGTRAPWPAPWPSFSSRSCSPSTSVSPDRCHPATACSAPSPR